MQKITPFLWFDSQTEEAINYYCSIFNDSKLISIKRYPEGATDEHMKGMEGKVLTTVFELEGQTFMALDGGPVFQFNPSVSFTVNCTDAAEVTALYEKLSEGGFVLMPLQQYPFNELYCWISDKYGVSWQLLVRGDWQQKIVPSFMFTQQHFGKCEEAINFYTSVFKHSSIDELSRYENDANGQDGKLQYASFILEGQKFIAMESNLDHKFTANAAISQYVECETQEEVDYYWNKLTEGGDPAMQQCGWVQDKYGFSWQIIPTALPRLLTDTNKEKADKALQAMMQMKKIDIAALEEAFNS